MDVTTARMNAKRKQPDDDRMAAPAASEEHQTQEGIAALLSILVSHGWICIRELGRMSQTCRSHRDLIKNGDDDIWASVYHTQLGYDSFGLDPEVIQQIGGYQCLIRKIEIAKSWPVLRLNTRLPYMPPPDLAGKNLSFLVTLNVFENKESTGLTRFSLSQQQLEYFFKHGTGVLSCLIPALLVTSSRCGETSTRTKTVTLSV